MNFFTEVDVNRIMPNPRNKNVHTDEWVQNFAKNLSVYGLINPIVVKPIGHKQYELVVGEGRWRAFKHLNRKKIPAHLMDTSTSEVAVDGIRLSENQMRAFDFIAECQELANLNNQGKTAMVLAKEFGSSKSVISEKVGIGNFPEDILKALRTGNPHTISPDRGSVIDTTWSIGSLRPIVRLRFKNDDGEYNYDEVKKAVTLVNDGEILMGAELLAYVAERRLELSEEHQQDILQKALETELEKKRVDIAQHIEHEKTELRDQLTETYQKQLNDLNQELAQVIIQAQKLRDERAFIDAKRVQDVNSVRLELTETHKKELSEKEISFSKQIEDAQKELTTLRGRYETDVSTAENIIKRDYEKRLKAIEKSQKTSSNRDQSETQKAINDLQMDFDKRLCDEQQKITHAFEKQRATLQDQMQNVVVERDKWKETAGSLQQRVVTHTNTVAELELTFREQLEEKDSEIRERDRRIKELVGQRAKIETDVTSKTKEEVEKQVEQEVAEYKRQLDTEYEKKVNAYDQYIAEREKALTLKKNKTIDDAINHFMDISNKFDASIRVLADYSEHFTKLQSADVLARLEWIMRKTTDAQDELRFDDNVTIDVNYR